MQKAADTLIKDMFQVKKGASVVITCASLSCMNVVNAVAVSYTHLTFETRFYAVNLYRSGCSVNFVCRRYHCLLYTS